MQTEQFDVVVCGGGPAGATVSALLAREGHRVLVLESARFPRYHIGESLIPGGIHVLRELGVIDKVDRHGFVVKRGNTYVWGRSPDSWSIAFSEAEIDGYAYQVVRSEFDHILLRHASECGAEIREECAVREFLFERGRCHGVTYTDNAGRLRAVRAEWTVDASGQACLLGRRMKLRRMDRVLNNIAIWSYFREAGRLPEPAAGYTLSAASSDCWIWYIPLHDGRTSVGVVTGVDVFRHEHTNPEHFFARRLGGSTVVSSLLSKAARSEKVHSARDWSYRCERLAGPGWLLIGDAAGFVDPILSTGCGLALQGALAGARALNSSLGGGDSTAAMCAFETFYRNYLGQFFDFVHYFYDANRHRESYYWKARRLLRPGGNATARNAFIYLISGLNGAATGLASFGRSFEMGVFDNLGSPLGEELLRTLRG
jgi:flavin-dependent dehydrogenase